jgi:hypothetical protein
MQASQRRFFSKVDWQSLKNIHFCVENAEIIQEIDINCRLSPMENIKFFDLLNRLDRREFEEFGLFLDSPYHNTSEFARKLYSIIKPFYPEFKGSKLTKEAIFKKLYPGAEYKDKKLRDLFSLTNALAENYLAISLFQSNKMEIESHALKQLGMKDLEKHFEQKAREISTALEKFDVKDEKYFLFKNSLMRERRLFAEFKRTFGKRDSFYVEMGSEIEQFIFYFITRMLDYYTHQFAHLMMINHESNFQLLDEIINYLSEKNLEAYPQINILHHLVILMRDRSKTDVIDKLEKLLNTPGLKIHKDLLRDSYAVLFNCTKELSMKSIGNYSVVYYDIMKQIVEKDLLPMENGYIESGTFTSFVTESLSHKDFDWSRRFIEQNYQKIWPEHRENLYTFSMGQLNYGLKNYDEALSLLSRVKSDDYTVFIRVKLQVIRIYFELNDYERTQGAVDALRHHLKANNKLPELYTKRYLTFATFMTKILTAIFAEDFDRLHFIHEEIKAASVFEFRKWLIQQLGILLESQKSKKKT